MVKITVINDGTLDDPRWTATDQDENYLFDAETLNEIYEKVDRYRQHHPLNEFSVLF